MSERIIFPDDWRNRLRNAVLVAVDFDWRRVHGELEKELESWPRVQVPTVEQIAMVLAGVRATADWEVFLSQWGEDAATYLEQAEELLGSGLVVAQVPAGEDEIRSVVRGAFRAMAQGAAVRGQDVRRMAEWIRDHIASQVPASEDEDLATAMVAAESGEAGHWPTVAAVLRDEVLRLAFGDPGAFREDEHGNVVNEGGEIVETAYYRSNAYQSDPDPASQSHPKPEVDPEHAKWDTHGDFTSADCGCSRCRPSEPNDWTPEAGERVEWNATDDTWEPATVRCHCRPDFPRHVDIVLDENRQLLRVESRHLRPASKDSERAEQ